MFFPTAGIEVALWLPPLVAFAVSCLTSMAGVSGAFLLLPFQISFLGYTHPSVSATNHLFNIVAVPSGVYRYYREGRLVWPLAGIVVVGTLPGVLIGAIVRVACLPDPKSFKLFAAAVLLLIGLRMIHDLLRKSAKDDHDAGERQFREFMRGHRQNAAPSGATGEAPLPVVKIAYLNSGRLGFAFCGEQFDVPLVAILALSFVVGILGGAYGVGGGAIIAPFFVTFFGLPVYTVAGATLMGTFATSVAGVIFYQAIAPFYPGLSVAPDWALGLLFGVGGMAGMYAGARSQKLVPPRAIKWMLVAIITFTAVQYVLQVCTVHS